MLVAAPIALALILADVHGRPVASDSRCAAQRMYARPAHLGWVSLALMVPIVVVGIAMCLLYHWTESLYPTLARLLALGLGVGDASLPEG